MDDMLDPYGDRVMKNVPMIARHPLQKTDLWKTTGMLGHIGNDQDGRFEK